MKSRLVIIGASGHGKVCAEIAALNGYKSILFLDDAETAEAAVGTTADIPNYISDSDFFVGIGNNEIRKRITGILEKENASVATLIHPQAVVAKNAIIGEGTVVMPGVVVGNEAEIGKGVILNTCCSADHNNVIGDFAHIAVGAHLAGTVSIGASALIGAGVSVVNNVSVCADCIIGAGAAVISSIDIKGTYVGVPARKIK